MFPQNGIEPRTSGFLVQHVTRCATWAMINVLTWYFIEVEKNFLKILKKILIFRHAKQSYALKNCVDRLSDEIYYPWESPQRNWLKSANSTATEQCLFAGLSCAVSRSRCRILTAPSRKPHDRPTDKFLHRDWKSDVKKWLFHVFF